MKLARPLIAMRCGGAGRVTTRPSASVAVNVVDSGVVGRAPEQATDPQSNTNSTIPGSSLCVMMISLSEMGKLDTLFGSCFPVFDPGRQALLCFLKQAFIPDC
ncbi:MAG: hypothetical protein BWY63_03657 [Chloroflexi bacterium ADurb.Bin360]|nr:MAG: hypothetical protein BWY63_03657 [Chloroflexi bacterium ADurb.Bin360]